MKQTKSTLESLLLALLPYSDENLRLVFKPSSFFSNLASARTYKLNTVKNAFYRSIKRGLIVIDEDGIPRLTKSGTFKIRKYVSSKLKDGVLMVTFDIAEHERWKRRHLRLLLKELQFQQVQKSVWTTAYDHREYLLQEIEHLELKSSVNIYECRKLN